MIGLEIVPLFFFTIGAACSWLVAWPGALAMRMLAGVQHWGGEPEFKAVRRAVFWALMAHLAAAAAMDMLTGTRHSLMAVIPVLNKSQCAPYCFSWTPAEEFRSGIRTVDDYYRTVVGSWSQAWLKYLLWQLPGVAGAFATLRALNPWESAGVRGILSLSLVTLLSVGLALILGMTVAVEALIGFFVLE